MAEVILSFLGIIIMFPFIVTIVFLIVMKMMGRAPVSVIGLAADVTTPLLFLAVYVVSNTIVGKNIGGYIAGIAIVIAIIIALLERKKVKEFRVIRLLRKTWRFYFLILFTVYLGLLVTGTVLKVVEYVK